MESDEVFLMFTGACKDRRLCYGVRNPEAN